MKCLANSDVITKVYSFNELFQKDFTMGTFAIDSTTLQVVNNLYMCVEWSVSDTQL